MGTGGQILLGAFAAALFSSVSARNYSVMAETPECVPLSQGLSYCTALEDGRVSFVGAIPGNVMTLAIFTDTTPGRTYFTIVSWEEVIPFAAYARENGEEFRAGREVRSTSSGVTGGYPSIKYDYPPGQETDPDFLVAVDTGAGYALIAGAEGYRTAEDVDRIVKLLQVAP